MSRPAALITNDDGIDSFFLQALVWGMEEEFDVYVAAPRSEQSWVGRRMTRYGPVSATPYPGLGKQAWVIEGTPSDCVNIALGHLLDQPPAVVVSGINFGFNATDTLVFSSGTIGGALEGACWRIPAVAASKWLPKDIFYRTRETRGKVGGSVENSIRDDGRRTAEFARQIIGTQDGDLVVHNLNFPLESNADTPIVETIPARIILGSLFARNPDGDFEFTYAQGELLDEGPETDVGALKAGNISYSRLNFSTVTRN